MLHDNLFHCSKQLTILVANCSVKKVSMTKIAEKDTNLVRTVWQYSILQCMCQTVLDHY